MTTARPIACSQERESATDASTATQSITGRNERPFPSTVDVFWDSTCSTNLRTRSNDPMSKDSRAGSDRPGNASSDPKKNSGVSVVGQSCGALASVEKIVRVCKAVFTPIGLAERRALQAIRIGYRSVAFGHARGRIDFGHPSFARWTQHGIQGAQLLEQLTIHVGEARDRRLQLLGGHCRRE